MQCILQLNGTENKKCSPWTSPLKHFGTGEALEAQTWDCLNITLAQKWHSDIFQISTEKSFQAWQKKFSALIEWIQRFCPIIFRNYNPKSNKKMFRNLLTSHETFFLQQFEKLQNAIFGPMQCLDSLACGDLWPLMLKSLGVLGWFIPSKNSRRTFLVFWRTHLVDIFLSYLPVKPIWRNIAVLGVDSSMKN